MARTNLVRVDGYSEEVKVGGVDNEWNEQVNRGSSAEATDRGS